MDVLVILHIVRGFHLLVKRSIIRTYTEFQLTYFRSNYRN